MPAEQSSPHASTAPPLRQDGAARDVTANLHKELFDAHRFYDVAEMRRRLETHLHWYNHARTHHALGGLLVPADRYYGRVAEVLARIEAGAGREIGDGIELRERCLELFKVTSLECARDEGKHRIVEWTKRQPTRALRAPPSPTSVARSPASRAAASYWALQPLSPRSQRRQTPHRRGSSLVPGKSLPS